MTSDKAKSLQSISQARYAALLSIIAILDKLEATENDTEHGDGSEAREWIIAQLNDEE